LMISHLQATSRPTPCRSGLPRRRLLWPCPSPPTLVPGPAQAGIPSAQAALLPGVDTGHCAAAPSLPSAEELSVFCRDATLLSLRVSRRGTGIQYELGRWRFLRG